MIGFPHQDMAATYAFITRQTKDRESQEQFEFPVEYMFKDVPDENKDGYDKSSLLTYAPGLSRTLVLAHGTNDDNVYFFHTLKLSEALFRAGRQFALLPLAGFTHMVPDPVVTEQLQTRVMKFLLDVLQAPNAPKAIPPAKATASR